MTVSGLPTRASHTNAVSQEKLFSAPGVLLSEFSSGIYRLDLLQDQPEPLQPDQLHETLGPYPWGSLGEARPVPWLFRQFLQRERDA